MQKFLHGSRHHLETVAGTKTFLPILDRVRQSSFSALGIAQLMKITDGWAVHGMESINRYSRLHGLGSGNPLLVLAFGLWSNGLGNCGGENRGCRCRGFSAGWDPPRLSEDARILQGNLTSLLDPFFPFVHLKVRE